MTDSTTAPAIAPAAIVSIEIRDPRRMMTSAPRMAPTTPPKLKAVRPQLAVPTSNPVRVSICGTQLVPM